MSKSNTPDEPSEWVKFFPSTSVVGRALVILIESADSNILIDILPVVMVLASLLKLNVYAATATPITASVIDIIAIIKYLLLFWVLISSIILPPIILNLSQKEEDVNFFVLFIFSFTLI